MSWYLTCAGRLPVTTERLYEYADAPAAARPRYRAFPDVDSGDGYCPSGGDRVFSLAPGSGVVWVMMWGSAERDAGVPVDAGDYAPRFYFFPATGVCGDGEGDPDFNEEWW